MALRKYDVLVTAQIEIGGTFEAETGEMASAAAINELRSQGELSNIIVERAIFLDDEPPAEELMPQLPDEAFEPEH